MTGSLGASEVVSQSSRQPKFNMFDIDVMIIVVMSGRDHFIG